MADDKSQDEPTQADPKRLPNTGITESKSQDPDTKKLK